MLAAAPAPVQADEQYFPLQSGAKTLHRLQAIFLGIIIFVILYLPFFHALWILLGLLLWLYGMWIGIKAHQGEDIEIPLIGDYARRYSIK